MSIEVCINKKFKGFNLNVSFATECKRLAVLGASGCGKSLSLKCISGIETPDAGKIIVNGKTFFDKSRKINIKPQSRNIGYMFQNYALFPHVTIEKNIEYALSMHKENKKEKVSKLLEKFYIEDLAEKYPRQLSGGQQQRAALARAMATEPDAFLLDEPFSALDTCLKEEMHMELMKMLAHYDGSTVMVTHDKEEAYKFSEKLLIIDKGEVIAFGDTKSLFHNPENIKAARLIGCENFSRIEKTGDRELYALDWGISLKTKEVISSEISFAGIRAKDFLPLYENEESENELSFKIKSMSEGASNITVVFRNAQCMEETQDLWWYADKGKVDVSSVKSVALKPENIMLLKS